MVFKGEGNVWDAAKDRLLCTFVDGLYETRDEYEITHLRKNGYEAIPETKAEIMEVLDSRGVSYNPRDKKADLEALL